MKFSPLFLLWALLVSLLTFPFWTGAVNIPVGVDVKNIPLSPTNLSGSFSYNQVVLSWTDNSLVEDFFEIERKAGISGSYVVVASTSANVATYIDASVAGGETYYYQVRAYNSDGYSGYSLPVSGLIPIVPTGGGGGGGGGGYTPPSFVTKAVFKGLAYPDSDVAIIRDAQVIATTKAGPDAKFEIEVTNISAGMHLFGVWAEDKEGNRSIMQTFNVSLSNGASTLISGIFIPPFLSLDKREVKRGDPITFFGVSSPVTQVTIVVNSDGEAIVHTTSSNSGVWNYKFDSLGLHDGTHQVRARAVTSGDISGFSDVKSFIVGDRNVLLKPNGKCPVKGDFNDDCRVNLTDFSMMAYWFKRTLTTAAKKYDLNEDGKVSLPDFSILAFHWTG